MALTNAYTDEETFRAYINNASAATALVDLALNGASRAIDAYCQRRFWLDDTPVARTFIPDSLITVKLQTDIGSTTGLQVATDPSGDGTFDIAWAASDFQLLPQNAAFEFPEARPWDTLRAVGTKTFPWLVNTWLTRLDRVQVTARWGWPAVPDAVTQACLLKAARLYFRKDSPQGVAGYGDFGPVRISAKDDADVVLLLDTYRRSPVLVT